MHKLSTSSKYHPLHSHRRMLHLPLGTRAFFAAVEGIEGGFAIGTSIVVALSVAGIDRRLLMITAFVSIVVSGFNSASVKYSSEHSFDELDGHEKKSALRHYFYPAFIEFVCYGLLGFLAVLPLFVIADVTIAVTVSVLLTLAMLFVAGAWRAHMLRMNRPRDGFETMLLGAGIIAVGWLSGTLVNSL